MVHSAEFEKGVIVEQRALRLAGSHEPELNCGRGGVHPHGHICVKDNGSPLQPGSLTVRTSTASLNSRSYQQDRLVKTREACSARGETATPLPFADRISAARLTDSRNSSSFRRTWSLATSVRSVPILMTPFSDAGASLPFSFLSLGTDREGDPVGRGDGTAALIRPPTPGPAGLEIPAPGWSAKINSRGIRATSCWSLRMGLRLPIESSIR